MPTCKTHCTKGGVGYKSSQKKLSRPFTFSRFILFYFIFCIESTCHRNKHQDNNRKNSPNNLYRSSMY